MAAKLGVGLVATNDLHYVEKGDAEAQDVLLCIQTASTVDDPKRMKFANDEYYLKSYEEMAERFADCPEALENTVKIAERCHVELEFGHLLLPEFPIPENMPMLRNTCAICACKGCRSGMLKQTKRLCSVWTTNLTLLTAWVTAAIF